MNILKSWTLTWQQTAVFKLGLLALGILIGAVWPAVFAPLAFGLGVIAGACLVYTAFVWLRQVSRRT